MYKKPTQFNSTQARSNRKGDMKHIKHTNYPSCLLEKAVMQKLAEQSVQYEYRSKERQEKK
jgi:hypothetical protein